MTMIKPVKVASNWKENKTKQKRAFFLSGFRRFSNHLPKRMKTKYILYSIVSLLLGLQPVFGQETERLKFDSPEYMQQVLQEYDKLIAAYSDEDWLYYSRSGVKKYIGDIDGAIEDCTQAIDLAPNFVLAYVRRAKLKKSKGDVDGANEDLALADKAREDPVDYQLYRYNRALKRDPTNARIYFERAKHKRLLGDREGAISDYTKYIDLHGGKPKNNNLVFFYRATLKIETRDIEGALADYQISIDLYPEDYTAYIKRAELKKSLGDREGAEKDLATGIAMERDLPVPESPEDIQKLLSTYAEGW